jgi:hypothetical protein
VGFEPTISAGEGPQTYALDRAATWTGVYTGCPKKIVPFSKIFLWAPDVMLEFCTHGNGGYFNQN